MQKLLTVAEIDAAAAQYDLEPALVRAVIDVESRGRGFLESGRPVILFEAHIFSRLTGGKFDDDHPEVSQPTWARGRKHYRGGEGEHDRLNAALLLDSDAALKSASWGLFQIMGFNHVACGFQEIEPFVEAMKRSERDHLAAFLEFCRRMKLLDPLRAHQWAAFARRYNGPGYARNRYDTKLAQAYADNGGGQPDPSSLEGQHQRAAAAQDAITEAASKRRA